MELQVEDNNFLQIFLPGIRQENRKQFFRQLPGNVHFPYRTKGARIAFYKMIILQSNSRYMKIARPILALIESFQKLPGIGPKSAQRLTYYLLHVPQSQLDQFADSVSHLKKDTVICSVCKNVNETDPCSICSDVSRDHSLIMVVEEPLDVLAFERTGKFKGVYQVLHGAINPLENIGPDEIYIKDLINRLSQDRKIKEIIIATHPTMEGEATAM